MKIAIAGYGVEGEQNYAYWSERLKEGDSITIVDERDQPSHPLPVGVPTILGEGAFSRLEGFDLVIRTAGLAPYKIKTDGRVWSATNEFFEQCPVKIIGVTGTKGKGTTASMIAALFEAAGKKVWLVGNIGLASLSVLDQVQPDDIVVYELSSFQLCDIQSSPQVAVVLGIEAEHLDVHQGMDDYVGAKARIRAYQKDGDLCIFNATNRYSQQIAHNASTGAVYEYGLNSTKGGHIEGDAFYVGSEKICPVDTLQLKGDHNKENACAAISVAHLLGVTNEQIAAGLQTFYGLPHRLEFIRTYDGVSYYNDSFSSSTPATIAASRAFSQPEIIIVGGIDRGGDFEGLARELHKQGNIKQLLLVGEIRHKLADVFKAAQLPYRVSDATTMKDIVSQANGLVESGDVVILSPGCASFDMFENFSDRGDQFRSAVNAIGTVNKGAFIFDSYGYNQQTKMAHFNYRFEKGPVYTESFTFTDADDEYDQEVFARALRLAFFVIGTSYFKTFPTPRVNINQPLDEWQAEFLNRVYQEGLSQYAYENGLGRDQLAHFEASTLNDVHSASYAGRGTLALQSGGKDSLLVASQLEAAAISYTPWYVTSSGHWPQLLEDLSEPLVVAKRSIDTEALKAAAAQGAKNGHVPVTYIVQSVALLQAILLNKKDVLVSIAHEGEEPHAFIGDLPVTHQWSKTWQAEQLFAEYVRRYISPDLQIGSPLRRYSELRVAELFSQTAWQKFGHSFSSCNRANYMQGTDNSQLQWCGECPKCANAYVLFAPFIQSNELNSLFNGQALFNKPLLQETFKGLFGVEGVMKPFECVGETSELRFAYHWAMKNGGYPPVSFDVPVSSFDYLAEYPSQDWAVI